MDNQYLLQRLADLIALLNTDELIAQFNLDTIYIVDSTQQEIQIPLLWADNSPHMLNLYIYDDNTLCLEYSTTRTIYDAPELAHATTKHDLYNGLMNSRINYEWI